jgi:hypothetical protein
MSGEFDRKPGNPADKSSPRVGIARLAATLGAKKSVRARALTFH